MDNRKPIAGHGELLKALTKLPDCTNLRFRIAAVYLAHARPPKLAVHPSARTVADLANCSVRSVHRAKDWLEKTNAVVLNRRRGRNRVTIVDFAPLAARVIGDRRVTMGILGGSH